MSLKIEVEPIITKARDMVEESIRRLIGAPPEGLPKEGDSRMGNLIGVLYDEARQYRDEQFARTKDSRFQYRSHKEFADACAKLEAGNHWDVWGHRNTQAGQEWKQEVVDDEMGDQIRARVAWLTSSWHDIEVRPNISHISEIIDEERKKTAWGRMIRSSVRHMLTFGDVDIKSYLDRSEDPNGVASEMVCNRGSVLYSPFAATKRRESGCWYAMHVQMVTGQFVKHYFPEVPLEELTEATYEDVSRVTTGTTSGFGMSSSHHTKLYPLIECYMDDSTLEDAPFDEEEFDVAFGALLSGVNVPVNEDDNHSKFIQKYVQYLDERVTLANDLRARGEFAMEDDQLLEKITQLIGLQIQEHIEKQGETGLPAGKRLRYPYGRLVVTISKRVVQDEANPYEFDWRMLFHRIYNEEVPGRLDGRGDVEILWNVNKAIDQNLSRFQDAALLNAIQKPWLHADDKARIEEEGYTNSPDEIGYFSRVPPVFPSARPASEYLTLYDKHKANAQKKLGVSEVTFGKSPTSSASGDLVEALISQNQVLVTGEANQNLNDVVEDIIETRIAMMKKFYTEPRFYTINGVIQAINVSRELSFVTVPDEEGRPVEKEIPKIEVRVRPESNFPMRWEKNLQLLLRLGSQLQPDGTPLIPSEMILDLLSEKFPQLSENGKYRIMSKATAIGLQVMKQQMADEEKRQAMKQRSESDTEKEVYNEAKEGFAAGRGGNGRGAFAPE